MKVALAHFQWFTEFKGGAERHLIETYDSLKDKVDFNLVTGFQKSAEGIPDQRYLTHYKNDSVFLKHLQYHMHSKKMLERIKPDITHAMTLSTHIRKPFIFWSTQIEYTNTDHWFMSSPMFRMLARHVFQKADAVQVHTECLKNQILRKIKIPAEKIFVIEQPVNKNIVIDEKLREQTRKELGIEDKTAIYFPARIIPNKRQDLLIKALALMDKNLQKNVVVLFSGLLQDKDYFESLKKLAEGLPVIFKPDISSNIGLYNACDIVAHPREITESGGAIIPEAMSLGKSLVLSDVESFRELSKGNALFFKPDDASDLAAKLERICTDEKLRSELITKGFDIIKKCYRAEVCCKKQLELYESVAKRGNL